MKTLILFLGVAFTSQVVDSGDDRYPAQGPGAAAESQSLDRLETNPHEDFVPPPVTPADRVVPPAQLPAIYPQNGLRTSEPDPLRSSEPAAREAKPSRLLQRLLTPVSQPMAGAPLTLADALVGATSRTEQTRRIERYWELSIAIADHYSAQRALTEFQTLRRAVTQPAESWNRWQTDLEHQAQFAQQQAKSLQMRLASELGRAGNFALPVPSDLPHCGKYDSRYDQIFSERLSPEANQLHQLLPMQYRGLQQEAANIAAGYRWLEVVSSQRNPQSGGEQLLQAYGLIATRRSQFLNLVRDYNTSIARYTELALPGQVNTERLVATLIQVKPGGQATWQRSGIQRTSAEEPVNDSPPRNQPPPTFDNGASGNSPRPPAAGSKTRERSIVVRRP